MSIYTLPPAKNQRFLDRYTKLMEWASKQNFEGYTEKHHIIPYHFYIRNRKWEREIKKNPNYVSDGFLEGDPNSKENLIVLSARVHFIAHYMLYKAYVTYPMIHAFNIMSQTFKGRIKLTAKQYEQIRKDCSAAIKASNTGIKRTVEQNQARAKRSKGRDNNTYNPKVYSFY